jgi:propanol-preferring alcohol dehydrogenase
MKSMRLLEFGKPLELVEMETPRPTGNALLVRIEAAGVCHTDLHLISGKYDLGEGKYLSLKDRGLKVPMTPGHEIAGTVDAVGESYTGTVKRGDRVVVYPWIGCGECRKCISGKENLCEGKPASLGVFRDGGYAEYVLVPDGRYAVKLQEIEPEHGALLACSALTAYSALKKCRLMVDDLLVIIGAGGLGTIGVQLAKKVSGAKVAVLDVDNSKLELAAELGADVTVNTANVPRDEAISKIKERNSGRGADAVIDFVGGQTTTPLGFDLLGKEGRLVLVGLFGGAAQFALPYFPLRGAEIMGNYTGTLRDLTEMVELTRRRIMKPVIAGTHKLQEANAVLERLEKREIRGRAVLKP